MANPRFSATNYLFTGAAITVSSSASANPAAALEDQLRQYFWQSATGWQITDDNNRIDFNRGGVKVATVANGYYATGAALCTAVTAALEAADSAPVWETTYGVAAANTFKIRDAGGAPLSFTMLWNTGANKYRSIGRSLGYNDIADSASVTTLTADNAAYQSTHTIRVQLTAAQKAATVTLGAVLETNRVMQAIGNGIKFQANATDVWSAPTLNTVFNVAAEPFLTYITDPNLSFYRLEICDVSNPAGYFRIGVFWLGSYTSSPYCFTDGKVRAPEDFSSVETGIDGTHFADTHRNRERWNLEVADIPQASIAALETFFDAIPTGTNIILDLQPPDSAPPVTSDQGIYGYLPEHPVEQHIGGGYWTWTFQFFEAL